MIRLGVLTVSDRAYAGEYGDETGPAIAKHALAALDAELVESSIVPDEIDLIGDRLRDWCDRSIVDLILTNGGTGLGPRDTTPEATLRVLDVVAPGIVELMRSKGAESSSRAYLSRQVAGRRARTLIVNLPGSVRGATESFEAVAEMIAHGVAMCQGNDH